MKRRILLISAILLLLAAIGAGTWAYYTASAVAENVITTKSVCLDIMQVGEVVTVADILPGDTVERPTTVKNSGTIPLFLRVKLTTQVKDSDLPLDDIMLFDLDDAHWVEKDGCYYYEKILQPGETTSALFTKIHFSGPEMDNRYLGKTLVLTVSAEAVQSEHNGTDPLTAKGWAAN